MTEPIKRGVLLHVIVRPQPAPANDSSYPAPKAKHLTFGVFDDEADAWAWAREHGYTSGSFSYVQMVKGETGIIPVPVKGYCPDKDVTVVFDSMEEAQASEFMRSDCWERHVLTEITPEEAAQLPRQ